MINNNLKANSIWSVNYSVEVIVSLSRWKWAAQQVLRGQMAFKKKYFRGAKMENARREAFPRFPHCARSLFKCSGKRVEKSRSALLQIPLRPWQRVTPVAGEGVPLKASKWRGPSRNPPFFVDSKAEPKGDGIARWSAAYKLGSHKSWSWGQKE